MSPPSVSVVIPSFNRLALLERLLTQLERQTRAAPTFEVVVVDDGSKTPVAPAVTGRARPYELKVETQPNAGAAAARHRGALAARGAVLLFVDDDMELPSNFVESHWGYHRRGESIVVLGRIRPPPGIRGRPLFERWHARLLERLAQDFRSGREKPSGRYLFTGNVSLRREDYLRVGGFDPKLAQSEDAELGLRLEGAGMPFAFCWDAFVRHASDRESASGFLKRAQAYGVFDERIWRAHSGSAGASPWRFLSKLHPLTRPWLAAAVLLPHATQRTPGVVLRAAEWVDRRGLERVALAGTTLAYAVAYFRGVRAEVGTLGAVGRDLGAFALASTGVAPLLADVREDHRALVDHQGKYGRPPTASTSLARNLIQNVGFQLLAGHRVARWLDGAGHPLSAQITTRLLRHLYGADIHWRAALAPGVTIVHGNGLVVGRGVRVGPGCILSQNVTLGMGRDPDTEKVGAPELEAGVHVGPGATLIGPICVGMGAKIAPGCVVLRSVPEGTLTRPFPLEVAPRARPRPVASNGAHAVGGAA